MTVVGAAAGLVLAAVLGLVLAPAPIHPWAGAMVLGGAVLGGQFSPARRRPVSPGRDRNIDE